MSNKITDDDIIWLELQVERQTDMHYRLLSQMDLKIARAVKEIQDA